METDRKARIEDLMEGATVLQGQMRHEEALGQLESLLVLDPMNDNALIQKQTLEDMINYRKQIEVEGKKSKEGIDVLRKTDEASIPYAGNMTYPDDWRNIIASPYRKSEEPLRQGHDALDPAARSPKVGERITFIGGETDFTKNKIGGITDAQTSSLRQGYAFSPPKTGQIDRWTSTSTWDSKPHSGMGEGGEYVGRSFHFHGDGDDVSIDNSGGGGGMIYGFPGGGKGEKNGDGTISYFYPYYPDGGFGGMGGYGGGGYAGGGMGYGGGMGGMGGGYSSNSGDGSGYTTGGYRGTRYDWVVKDFYSNSNGRGGDGGNGVMSGDTLTVTGGSYNGDINFKGKETNFFDISSDDPAVIADGMAVGGRVTLQDGKAVGIEIDKSIIDNFEVLSKDAIPSPVTVDVGQPVTFTKADDSGVVAGDDSIVVGGSEFYKGKVTITDMDFKGSGLNSPIDSFNAYIDKDGDRKPVTVVAGQPVTSTRPELALPSQPRSDVSGITELPGITSQSGSAELHALWRNTSRNTWFEDSGSLEARKRDEAVVGKTDDEARKTSYHYQLIPEEEIPAKPPVLTHGKVVEGSRQDDASKETEESSTEYSELGSRKELEKTITNALLPRDEIKALLKKGLYTNYSLVPRGSGDKKESDGVPLLGDIPITGGWFRTDGKKRPLSDEGKKRLIAHLEARKSQSEGEPVELGYETIKLKNLDPRKVGDSIEDGFRDRSGGDLPKVSIEALPENQQIIVFGHKEQREAFKKMVQEIDIPPGQSAVDRTSTVIGEDEPELPPSSRFKLVPVNPWVMSERDSFSTFALDVDTASYALCRRYIRGGFQPPAGAVRMEEFVNYFNYQYPQRTNPTFKVHAEAAPSPFARKDQNLTLLKVGVKARTIGRDQRKAAHLIFVVDASASMGQPDRLPLVQRALDLLVNKLSAVDRVTLITCANEARLHLETIPARERDRLRQAIYAIQPAGSTNLLAGLKLGYATARRSFAPKQINHVVLCSDGVANVGQTEAEAVLDEVAADRKQGITITCVGVGYGSYNDAFMEALANRGDGSYMFLDSARQAHRVFVRQLAATLQTVAKDARIQVDFNPNRVRRYRLIGYENRDIEDKRFRDDTIDAGEVGSGQCSTALYELEMIGRPSADRQDDLGTVFVRYRNVATGQIEEISNRLGSAIVRRRTVESAPRFFLAAGAARFAEILRQSEHAQHGNLMDVLRVVEQVSLALPLDRDVRELVKLVRKAEGLPRSP
ncbi:MAG: YfbK domain-containing protein [Planctomycetota bacterium]|jgi:Ca-activated chloride channel family protein